MSAVSDRQRKMEINRSLRNIKNELETLLEKGVITDDAFDSIHNLLPPEGTLGAAAPAALPTPASSVASPLPTNALADLNINNRSASPAAPAPPSYAQSTGNSQPSGPPALPSRSGPPPPAPTKPVLSHARALYRYSASDARDCTFERDDRIAVYEYMNNDWWMGMNLRTGKEGIFPRTYVEPEASAPSPAPGPNGYYNEKAAPWQPQGPPQPMYAQPQGPPPMQMNQGGGYPAPPPQGVPYNNQAPPAEQEGGGSGGKMGEHGKKFGKKLGNAAIFGAGATIGSNIVNSIF